MIFNPKKCEFLRISNKKNIIPNIYYIDNHSIKEVTHAKYLGVIFDQTFSWNEHIKQIASKATKVNTFLHHNLYHCLVNTKLNLQSYGETGNRLCFSCMRPPHTYQHKSSRSSSTIGSKVVLQGLLLILKCFINVNLPTLKSRRNRAKLQMMYKITNNLVCIPNDCLIPIPPFLRNGYFNQLDTRIDSFKFSFSPQRSGRLWSSIPPVSYSQPPPTHTHMISFAPS